MPLYCPFCHAEEADRVEAVDEQGKRLVLLMFDCPFAIRVDPIELQDESKAQLYLTNWRIKEGDLWLDKIGPILKERETRNIEKFKSSLRP
ncbi:MAG: hypothetical protein ACYCQJ_04350 [Nitrososphaerales archaeon]